MADFKNRSNELEMMDQPLMDSELLHRNLRELETINILTGGPRLTFSALKKLTKSITQEITIVDVGYGAGDLLHYIWTHKEQLPYSIKLVGVDYSPQVKNYIDKYQTHLLDNVEFITADYRDYFRQEPKIDIVTANLFCHHLTDEELIEFLSYTYKYARIGGIINDLHRHRVAYYGIKLLTSLFSQSVFTKNDAPLSVLRGFTRGEWENIIGQSPISTHSISWEWAFRHLITFKK